MDQMAETEKKFMNIERKALKLLRVRKKLGQKLLKVKTSQNIMKSVFFSGKVLRKEKKY